MEASGAPEAKTASICAALLAHTSTGAAQAAAVNSPPISRSPILRKSGSLTPTQAPAANSNSCGSREDERRRDFQRVKTVSFANLDSVNEDDTCHAAAAIPVPDVPVEPARRSLEGIKLDGGASEKILTDDETDRASLGSAAWARYAQSASSNSSFSLYLPLGSRLRHAFVCCCCNGVYSWFRKLGPGNDLAFHTREDLQLEQQQKRHTRMASRSSTMSSTSGAARSCSMRGSSTPSEKHMRSFPLSYTNKELEELFALNVNHWMSLRLLPMGLLLLVLTLALWPLLAWSFDQQSTFDHTGAIGIMFNSAMAVTVLAAIALSTAGCASAARKYAEHLTSLMLLLVSFSRSYRVELRARNLAYLSFFALI